MASRSATSGAWRSGRRRVRPRCSLPIVAAPAAHLPPLNSGGRGAALARRLAAAALPASAVALAGWRRSALTKTGAIAAAVVGTLVYGLGGLAAAAALVAFFVSGSRLSRRRLVSGELVAAKGGRRDALQVLANGGAAATAAILANAGYPHAQGGILGALAAAAADTWASEIGVRSSTPPRLITTGERVPPGTSGGVTRLGWLASAGGAAFVAAAYLLAGRGRDWPAAPPSALLGGLLGSLADSLVGATLQASYRCDRCGQRSESPRHACARGGAMRVTRGRAWMTNDGVNLVGTTVGAAVGAAVWSAPRCATLGPAPAARVGRQD